MAQTAEDFATRYEDAFRAYVSGAGEEAALEAAYELGRQAIAERLSLMELAEAHHRALRAALDHGEAPDRLAEAAAAFFRESLATYELATRAFHDAQDTVRLEQSHAAMQQALAEAAVAINEHLDPRTVLMTAVVRACELMEAAHATAEAKLDPKEDPIRAEAGRAANGTGSLSAPLYGRGRKPLGELTVSGSKLEGSRAKRRSVLLQLAQMASSAIENGQRYERERRVAETLQRSLLPPSLPELPGIESAAAYWAAGDGIHVGGDFYDVFRVTGGDWAVVIGDVCGKGPSAAALTALARYTARAAGLHEESPAEVLRLLNAAMLEHRTDGRFATVLCAYLHVEPGMTRLVTATGGHPLPIVLRADGRVERIGVNGTLLGVIPEPAISDSEAELLGGDTVLLFTDGVIEIRERSREVFGTDDLIGLLGTLRGESPAAIIGAIHSEVSRRAGGALRDDVALLAFRVRR